jgi:hypothetical protein
LKIVFARSHEESGAALLTALLALLVLSTLTASFVFVAQAEMWSTSNYKTLTQARYLAEAGAEKTADWMRNSYAPAAGAAWDTTKYPVQWNNQDVLLSAMDVTPSNYPNAKTQDDFKSKLNNQPVTTMGLKGTYSTKAKLLSVRMVTDLFTQQPSSLDTWKITSVGKIDGVRPAQVEVEQTLERRGIAIFNYGLYATGTGCKVIDFSGAGLVDSFDSSVGAYDPAKLPKTGGDIGSNGNTNLSSSSTVWGTLSTPLSKVALGGCSGSDPSQLTTSGSASVKEAINHLDEPPEFALPGEIKPAPPNTNDNVNGNCAQIRGCSVGSNFFSLEPGGYGNIVVTGGKTLIVRAGTYNINSITMSGGSTLKLISGPAVFNIAGGGMTSGNKVIDLSGGGLANTTGIASNLRFIYRGDAQMTFSGGSDAYALVYAPNAAITITGTGDWYGAIVSKTFTATGGSKIHYDRALQRDFFTVGRYKTMSFSWTKY